MRISKRRALCLIVMIIIFLVFWFFYAAPFFEGYVSPFSEDFSYQADIFSMDNFYDEEKQAYNNTEFTKTIFEYYALPYVGSHEERSLLFVKNNFAVRTLSGEEVFSVQRQYAIDKKTGAHVTAYCKEGRDGYLFAPQHLKKQGFTYWHVNYDAPAHMIFQNEEEINGVQVYKYEAQYHADQTEELGHLPGVPEERGIILDITLQLWIEPVSGWLVSYKDNTSAYYYNLTTGERTVPWNSFSNSYTDSSMREHAARAQLQKSKLLFIDWVLPLLFIAFFSLVYFQWMRVRKKKKRFLALVKNKLLLLLLLLLLGSMFYTFSGQADVALTLFLLSHDENKPVITGVSVLENLQAVFVKRSLFFRNVLDGIGKESDNTEEDVHEDIKKILLNPYEDMLFAKDTSGHFTEALQQLNADSLEKQEKERFTVVYTDTAESLGPLLTSIKDAGIAEKVVESFNEVFHPSHDVILSFEECGAITSYYSSQEGKIVICYELVEHLQHIDNELGVSTWESGLLFFILHEFGHAILDVYTIPVVGREEQVADNFATIVLLHAELYQDLLNTAFLFHHIGITKNHAIIDYSDEHSSELKRYYNLLCYLYGKERSEYVSLVMLGVLPQERAELCKEEYKQLQRGWNVVFSKYVY